MSTTETLTLHWKCPHCRYYEITDEAEVVVEALHEHLEEAHPGTDPNEYPEPTVVAATVRDRAPSVADQAAESAVRTASPDVPEPTRSDPEPEVPTDTTRRGYWTRDLCLDAIVRWAIEHGAPPASTDWSKAQGGYPSHSHVKRACGQWNQAIIDAGYSPRQGGAKPGVARPTRATRLKAPPVVASGEIDLVAAAKYVQGLRDEIRSLESNLAATRANLVEAEQIVRDAIG